MTAEQSTKMFIRLIVVLCVSWTIMMKLWINPKATISHIMYNWAEVWNWFIPIVVGIQVALGLHFWWPILIKYFSREN